MTTTQNTEKDLQLEYYKNRTEIFEKAYIETLEYLKNKLSYNEFCQVKDFFDTKKLHKL